MVIQAACNELKGFFRKCYCGGLIKDLVVQATKEEGLFARFCTEEHSLYAEVYLKNVKVGDEGTIKIPNLKKVIDVMSRIDSKVQVRIVSTEDAFCITDGAGVGKMKADMLQTDDASFVGSFKDIANKGKMFDKESLKYEIIDVDYINGASMPCGMLSEVLKDAKAFGYEVYSFVSKQTKGKNILRSVITNQHTTEKTQRTVCDSGFVGDVEALKTNSTAGKGFREVLDGVLGDENEMIHLYFHDLCWLITDKETFFFNLHTLV